MSEQPSSGQSDVAVLGRPADQRDPSLYHIYPHSPAWPGDRALCGYVKRKFRASEIRIGDHPDLCLVCSELWGYRR